MSRLPVLLVLVVVGLVLAGSACEASKEQPAGDEPPPPPSTKTCAKLFGQTQLCCPAGSKSSMPAKLRADPIAGFELEAWCQGKDGDSYPSVEFPDAFVFSCPVGALPATTNWSEEGTSGIELHCLQGETPQGPYLRFWPSGPRFETGTYSKAGVREGSITRWHENGKQSAQGEYAEQQREGVWTFYDEEGNRIREDHYRAGKRHGRALAWWKNGQPRYEMDMHEDVIHGQWTEFWFNGNKKQDCLRDMGSSKGVYSSWWENGQMAARGERRGKSGCGTWECWNADGSPTSCFAASDKPGEAYTGCKSTPSGASCPKCKD
ncbi:MAG: hypothetical protein RBU37_20250 [Myxococcota bacterium]|nr:hypothetical protein [Myxococcota bacterium]